MEHLVPTNKSISSYDGFLHSNGKCFRLQIDMDKSASSLENASIKCDWKLRHYLKDHIDVLHRRLKHAKSLAQFVTDLQIMLDHSYNPEISEETSRHCYGTIIEHLQKLGWNKIYDVSSDFSEVKIEVQDSSERTHFISFMFGQNYPEIAPRVLTTLPFAFIPLWAKGSTLQSILEQFKEILVQYERFWSELDELKFSLWILEPENLSYAATSLRIALGNNSSLQIKIDPFHPEIPPGCHFLGADWAVLPFREKFHANFANWNETLSIVQNLQNLLETKFPQKPKEDSLAGLLQCGICYTYRLGPDVPDQICNERRCNQSFHHECLLQWVQSIPGVKQSFNILFGECPYCTGPIKIPILHSLVQQS